MNPENICNEADDNCNGANGCEAVAPAPREVGVSFFEGVDANEHGLFVSREPDGDVRCVFDPCGPEVTIPPGIWDRLFTLPPATVRALRAAAGLWPPPVVADEADVERLRFTRNAPRRGECQVIDAEDAVILRVVPAVPPADGACACCPDLAFVVGLDVALEATSDPTRFRVRFYEGGRLAGELVDVPPGLLTAT